MELTKILGLRSLVKRAPGPLTNHYVERQTENDTVAIQLVTFNSATAGSGSSPNPTDLITFILALSRTVTRLLCAWQKKHCCWNILSVSSVRNWLFSR